MEPYNIWARLRVQVPSSAVIIRPCKFKENANKALSLQGFLMLRNLEKYTAVNRKYTDL